MLVAVTALLLLGTAIGSGGPPPGLPDPLWAADVGSRPVLVDATNVYLVGPGRSTVSARDRVTGRVRWQVSPADPPVERIALVAGVLAIQSRAGTDIVVTMVSATGAATTTFGTLVDLGVDLPVVVVLRRRPDCPLLGCAELVAVDPVTGADARSVSYAGASVPDTGRRVSRFAAVGDDGAVTVYSLATGRPTNQLTAPVDRDGATTYGLVDDLFLTAIGSGHRLRVTAAALAPAVSGWSVTLDLDRANSEQAGVFGCGRLLCVVGRGTILVDPATGQVRGRTHGIVRPPMPGSAVLLDRLPSPPGGADAVTVVSATDGSVLSPPLRAAVVPWIGGGGRSLLAETEPGAGGTRLVVVEAAGRLRPLGTVDGADLDCQARDDVLACVGGQARLRVWRLPI